MSKVKPKKHFGQHFLKDVSIAKKIADNVLEDSNCLIEIGPGMGMLTQFILNKSKNFIGIEIDYESVLFLNNRFPNLNIMHEDFLKFNLSKQKGELDIVGNFPYNISSQILFKVLESNKKVRSLIGMFQLEVGERISSQFGSKKYGILSVLLQTYYNIDKIFIIDSTSFYPPPKVKSIVIKLTRNKRKTLKVNEKLYIKVVKAAFNQRRKILRNALNVFTFKESSLVNELFSKRAEELKVEEFINLTRLVVCK